jgi:DNA-binding NtrC family response regulator
MRDQKPVQIIRPSQPTSIKRKRKKNRFRYRIQDLRRLAAAVSNAVEELGNVEISPDLLVIEDGVDFYSEVREFEISLIERALWHTNGSQAKAASLMRINHTTLNAKIKAYEINRNLLTNRRPPRQNPKGLTTG